MAKSILGSLGKQNLLCRFKIAFTVKREKSKII